MKNYVLFDFDGTVFDSAEGITKSVQYALGKMGIHAETSELMCFAGPPLDEMFSQRYGMDEETAHRAVEFYRERYTPIGWEECSPFPGMHELMGKLHAKGIKLAVATSKPRVLRRKYSKSTVCRMISTSSAARNSTASAARSGRS